MFRSSAPPPSRNNIRPQRVSRVVNNTSSVSVASAALSPPAVARQLSTSRSTVLGDNVSSVVSLSRNRASRLREALALSSRKASDATTGRVGARHSHTTTLVGAGQLQTSKQNAGSNNRNEREDSDIHGWIAELTPAVAQCMRVLGSHTMLLPVRLEAVRALLRCLRRAESAMQTTLASHSDIVIALDKVVPRLLFQLKAPRDADEAVLDLLQDCCVALRLIAEMLRQLLPVRSSFQIAAAVVEALLIHDATAQLDALVQKEETANNGSIVVHAAAKRWLNPPPHLSFLHRERHPWEPAAHDCLAAVARNLESPVTLLPVLLAKMNQRCEVLDTLRTQRTQMLQRRGSLRRADSSAASSSNNSISQQQQHNHGPKHGTSSRASSADSNTSAHGANHNPNESCASSVSGSNHYHHHPRMIVSGHHGSSSAAFLLDKRLPFGAEDHHAGASSQEYRSLAFVVELVLTLLEDAASKQGLDRAYAVFPSRGMRIAEPFVLPHGVSTNGEIASPETAAALRRWFADKCGASLLRGTDVHFQCLSSAWIAHQQQQAQLEEQQGILADDDDADNNDNNHMIIDHDHSDIDGNSNLNINAEGEVRTRRAPSPPPHPLEALEWETDPLSDLWNFFSTVLVPAAATAVDTQVRALALLYAFFPGDVAMLVDKAWDSNDVAVGRRRCLAQLAKSPPFPLLIVHHEMLITARSGHNHNEKHDENEVDDEEEAFAAVVGSCALVPLS